MVLTEKGLRQKVETAGNKAAGFTARAACLRRPY